MRVDLPTLGFPMIVTNPDLNGLASVISGAISPKTGYPEVGMPVFSVKICSGSQYMMVGFDEISRLGIHKIPKVLDQM